MATLVTALDHEFRRHQALADQALAQLAGDLLFARPAPQLNSAAIIVKHLSGSLRSRWTNFLTTDGEKPDRDRDAEFSVGPETRAELLAGWEQGWGALYATLAALRDDDLQRTVLIRHEEHTVLQALLRGLSHATYHVGQLLYLTRWLLPHAQWLTIPPGQSQAARRGYLATDGR